jgi:hypothetical protein
VAFGAEGRSGWRLAVWNGRDLWCSSSGSSPPPGGGDSSRLRSSGAEVAFGAEGRSGLQSLSLGSLFPIFFS